MIIAKGYSINCIESVLADAIYNFSNGNFDKSKKATVEKTVRKYIKQKADEYNPIEYELLEYILQL